MTLELLISLWEASRRPSQEEPSVDCGFLQGRLFIFHTLKDIFAIYCQLPCWTVHQLLLSPLSHSSCLMFCGIWQMFLEQIGQPVHSVQVFTFLSPWGGLDTNYASILFPFSSPFTFLFIQWWAVNAGHCIPLTHYRTMEVTRKATYYYYVYSQRPIFHGSLSHLCSFFTETGSSMYSLGASHLMQSMIDYTNLWKTVISKSDIYRLWVSKRMFE